jgi:NADH-quinone oxidoreductase subunit M
MNILSLFVVIPTLMLILLFLTKTIKQIRIIMVAGASALITLATITTIIFLNQRAANPDAVMLLTQSHVWFEPLKIAYSVGVDGISVAMLALSAIIVFTGVFSSWKMTMAKEFFIWYCLLAVGVFGFFISTDLFTMFMFYEVALIPMYLLIGLWGTGKKEYSAMKLTLMLMGASTFLLVGIIGIHYTSGHQTFNIIEIAEKLTIPIEHQKWIFPVTFLGFGVLGALFPFHTWSPDGHASAPTAVSMLHAGVLMKLGGYGCFRVAIYLMPEAAHELGWIFLILTGISVIYGALGAVQQTDLKYINAYSSVSHCGLVLFAILMLNKTAMTGAVMQMISHGLMTALFFALIGLIYGRTHTRDIRELGGLMKIMPFASLCYVIAGLASLGLPGLSGFVAEMTIFTGAFGAENIFPFNTSNSLTTTLAIVACCSIVITAVYILRTVAKILYGPVQNKQHLSLSDADRFERISIATLILAIVFMGFYPSGVSNLIYDSMAPIIGKLAMLN